MKETTKATVKALAIMIAIFAIVATHYDILNFAR